MSVWIHSLYSCWYSSLTPPASGVYCFVALIERAPESKLPLFRGRGWSSTQEGCIWGVENKGKPLLELMGCKNTPIFGNTHPYISHYKDCLLKVGWPSPIKRDFWPQISRPQVTVRVLVLQGDSKEWQKVGFTEDRSRIPRGLGRMCGGGANWQLVLIGCFSLFFLGLIRRFWMWTFCSFAFFSWREIQHHTRS